MRRSAASRAAPLALLLAGMGPAALLAPSIAESIALADDARPKAAQPLPAAKPVAPAKAAPGKTEPAKVENDLDDEKAPLSDEDFKKVEEEAKKRRAAAEAKKKADEEAAKKAVQAARADDEAQKKAGSAFQKKLAAAKGDPSQLSVEQRLDIALEHYYAKRYLLSSAALYDLYVGLPEADLKRDTVAFYLADSLASLSFAEGAVDHYIDIVVGRRAPELVIRALAALDQLVRSRALDEGRLIDEVLFGSQFGELPPDIKDFVEYYQGLGELRRGFANLGVRRLEDLSHSSGYYGWKSRYALAVDRLALRNDEGAEKLLAAIVSDDKAPRDIRNDARTALARTYYEQKKYPEAFTLYADNDAPLTSQDVILVEKAWSKVGSREEQLALGQVVGLGAPVYRLTFAPERFLIRAASLDRLCQFRAAHIAVRDFRRQFSDTLRRIRERRGLANDPVLRPAALARKDLVPEAAWRARMDGERAGLKAVLDKPLRTHLETIYSTRIAQADAAVGRSLDHALAVVADELLLVDEQMTILDYEIGVGLFKGVSGQQRDRAATSLKPIPPGGDRAYYAFDGEYWSDEIGDFEVRAEDRCLR